MTIPATMKEAVFPEAGSEPVVRDTATPSQDLAEGMCLCKVERLGVCGTEIDAGRGTNTGHRFGTKFGHEGLVTLLKKGPNTKADLVEGHGYVVNPYTGRCQITEGSQCRPCSEGRFHHCVGQGTMGNNNPERDGLAAEYVLLEDWRLVDAEGLNPDQAALVEPGCVALEGVNTVGSVLGPTNMGKGHFVTFGAGFIGLMTAPWAIERGWEPDHVSVVYRHEVQRRAIEAFGAHPICGDDKDAAQQILDHSHGDVRAMVLAAGGKTLLNLAIEVGTTDLVISRLTYSPGPEEADFNALTRKVGTIKGSRNAAPACFPHVAAAYRSGRVDPTVALTHRFNWSTLPKLMETVMAAKSEGTFLKAVIEPN